ncbi:DUF1573 domain-containing protein [Niastella populi]|uniref:DUF1573 domain-containing protein n=1 Tax=Niastella populi TaxID=550983 RepID=A0A1V9FD68_9BACT|nr:DUF1573 domain-containing protein [Niastella populi]OQP56319.1 hypothetical protein A4R26_25825 [Niastella populi]
MKYFLALISAAVFIGCDYADKTASGSANVPNEALDSAKYTTIQWIDSSRNYGKITEGQTLDVSFRFKNTGDKPLIIMDVKPGCGCTAAEPPKEPIAPGAEGVIKASFNSHNRPGHNSKDIYVEANTKGTRSHTVHFEVDVEKAN